MLYILVLLIGAIIGMFIVALISVDNINEAESLVRASRKSLRKAEEKITERNKLIKTQRKQIEKQKNKIIDLENNIELLVNNSKNKKLKELVCDNQSQN